jgi:hypothetical protein
VRVSESLRERALPWARDVFLLRRAERTVAAYPADVRSQVGVLVRAARERAGLAELALDREVATALWLYREAALLWLRAIVAARTPEGTEAPSAAVAVVARFASLGLADGAPVPREQLDELLRAVREGDSMEPTRLSSLAVTERAHAARAVVAWLGTLVEARSLGELRWARVLRVGAAALVAVALLVWSGGRLLGTKNVALHKPVRTSGLHPQAIATPGGLTDGVIAGPPPYGVHTAVGSPPWVQVDLGDVYKVSKVKVYNRGDGWFDDGLPMTVQLSVDGTWFADVETRRSSFSQKSPWVANAHREKARYVRVRGTPGKYVTLSEVEVWAR